MHIIMFVVFGLIALGVLLLLERMVRGGNGATAARAFIVVWFVAALVNGAVGYFKVGVPFINELGAFIPIFAIPAAAAWFIGYRNGGNS